MIGIKREELTDGCRKLHNEELRHLYTSSDAGAIKLRRMKWIGYVAGIGTQKICTHISGMKT